MQADTQQIVEQVVAALNEEKPCPLCGLDMKKTAILNNVTVCKRCRTRFLSRREWAYFIDVLLYNALVYPCVFYGGTYILTKYLGPFVPRFPFWLFTWGVCWLMFICKDGFAGMSPGKWVCGVQVVDVETREPTGFGRSCVRNLPTLLPYLGAIVILMVMTKGRRWGDGWARTVVIWRKHARKPPFDPRGIFCLKCDYELTGNVSGICPECGTPVPPDTRDRITLPGT